MATRRLSDALIRNLDPPARGQYDVWDSVLPNFSVRVSQGGTVSYGVWFRQNRVRRRVSLGTTKTITLAAARAAARKILASNTLERVPGVVDPITFASALETFLETHVAANNKPSTAYSTNRLLRKYFLEPWRYKKLNQIAIQDVTRILDACDSKSEAAHAFSVLRKFFNWAKGRSHVIQSPITGFEGYQIQSTSPDILALPQLKAIISTARGELAGKTSWGVAQLSTIVLLLILTGQRRAQIAQLKWDYIQEQNRYDAEGKLTDSTTNIVWPGPAMKNNQEHVLPLTAPCRYLITKQPKVSKFVFPARGNTATSFTGFSKSKLSLRARMGEDEQSIEFSLHQLRHTFSTGLGELDVEPHVIDAITAHRSTTTPIHRRYNRYHYVPQMRTALDRWAAHLGLTDMSDTDDRAAMGRQ